MAPPPLRRSGAPQVPAHAVTEDTPADMLTGQMSLSVLLPDGRHCRMNVDRGTPMMDLLIQVATANKISPGGHVIQVISDRSHSCLSYKPSTPIGTLDTTALRIVPKNKINELPSRRTKPPPQNPMADAKIRIKVYLPRNQLSAMRVSPKTPLAEVLDQICKDKNLDVSRYELRHPVNVDERLRPSCCLADYKLQEVTVVPLNSRTNTVLSSADIIAMQKKSDGKRKIFAIFGKKSKPSVIESTASSDSLGERSVSPDGSDESADRPRSLSPQPPQVIQAPPRAKKRAAPKPPQINGSGTGRGGPPPAAAPAPAPAPVAARPPSELSEGAESVESRHSSDSSGYHEAGLSDAPDSPTERAPVSTQPPSNLGSVTSYSTSNLVTSNLTQVNSTSTVSLSSAIRKRRAPPPPAIPRIAEDPQSPPPRQAPAAAPAATASVASQPVEQQPRQSEEVEPSPGSPRSSASSPERTRLKAPLRQDSGTSSTETLTAESAAGSDPAPAPTPAPAPAPAPVEEAGRKEVSVPAADSARTETAETEQTSSGPTTVERSVDHPSHSPKNEPDAVDDVSKTESETPTPPSEVVEEKSLSNTVSEPPAVVTPEPERPTVPEPSPTQVTPAAAPVAAPSSEKPIAQPPASSLTPAPAAEPIQTTERAKTVTPPLTVEESLPQEVVPAVRDTPHTETAAPTVTETSAPVVLEAPAASETPTAPAVEAETLPVESRQKESIPVPVAESKSEPSSSEPTHTTEPSEEDDETALLQREVDSALSCLDLDLDEALAESAAFTESSSLQTQSRLPPTETETETSQETEAETLPVVVRETAKTAPETQEPEQPQRTVLTSRQTMQETREVIETLLPVARVTESEAVPSPTLPSATVRTQSEEVITVTERQTTAPSTETTREPATPQPSQTARVAERTEQRVESVATKRRTPKLGATSRQHPVEVEEEVVVERVEKVQRNRMTPKDIKLHIERKLASFDQPPRSPPQPSQLISPPTSAPAAGGADSPDWQYRLPEPPTPFQDPATSAGRTAPLEAPLEFQDNMTVTSSEPSEAGEFAEATNAPLVERVGRSDPARPTADQSEAAPASGSQSDATPASRDQWDGGRSERPAKPERRRSSERLARQMSFSIGAYSQREPTGTEGGGSAGRPQRADSFHCQKTTAGSASQVTSGADPTAEPAGPEMTARRPVSRRRSSDAAAGSRGQRSAETDRPAAAEPVRPPRKYELKFNNSKSYSMLNLSNGGLTMPAERPSPNMNKTQSQTDLAMESEVSDIQSEFLKLQRQFLHWQQQLLQNQSILQTKVAPLAARPSAAASLQSLEVRRPSEPLPPPPICVESVARRRPSAQDESPRRRRQAPTPPTPIPPPPTPVSPPAPVTPAEPPEGRDTPPPAVPAPEEFSSPSPAPPAEPSTSFSPVLQSTSSPSVSAPLSGAVSGPSAALSSSLTVSLSPSTSPVLPVDQSTTPQVQSTPPVVRSTPVAVHSTPLASVAAVRASRPTGRRRTPPPVPAKLSPQQLASRRRQPACARAQVIEELRRRVPEQEDSPDPPADYSGRSQSLPRGSSLQHPKLSLAAEQRRSEPEPQPEPEREPERSTARTRERERTPPRQRASTLERRQESEPEPTRQRASTLERKPSEARAEKRVPWSPPKVALGTWAEQSRQSQVQLKEDRDYVLRQGPPPQSQQAAPESTSEQAARRPTAVSVRPSKSVTVTSLGAPPPPVGVPLPQPAPQPVTGQQRLSAVAKVRHNESVPAPTAVLSSAVRGPSTRQPPAFSISDSKPSQPGRGVAAAAAAGRFTSVVSLTDEPRQPLSVSVQVSKTAARVGAATTAARPAESTTVTCRVSPPDQTAAQPRTVPSVVSVTRKDSATSTELSARQAASEVSRRSRNQPVVKGFRQPEVPAPVPPPPPPPAPVLPPTSEAAAGRARLKPVSAGRPVVPKLNPREELMIAIREHGGLKKRGGVRP